MDLMVKLNNKIRWNQNKIKIKIIITGTTIIKKFIKQ